MPPADEISFRVTLALESGGYVHVKVDTNTMNFNPRDRALLLDLWRMLERYGPLQENSKPVNIRKSGEDR